MAGEAGRALIAGAIRAALESGIRQAEDPVAYLGTAREEMRALAGSLTATGLDEDEEYDLQLMVVQEVSQAIGEMLARLRN